MIAHRLETVLDSDLIIVMDAGKVAESGAPAQLLRHPEGAFSVLYRDHLQASKKRAE